MDKKYLVIGLAVLVMGGIGYTVLGSDNSKTPNTMKGSIFAIQTPSIAVVPTPVQQGARNTPQPDRDALLHSFNTATGNLAVLVNKYKAGTLLMGSCSPRAIEFSQNIETAYTSIRSLSSTLTSRDGGQQDYLSTNFTNNAAQIRNNMSAISTSITMADALLRTIDFSNASACSSLPAEVRSYVFPNANSPTGSNLTAALNQLNYAYTQLTR